MSDKYIFLIYYVHSYLESVRDELHITKDTTVENFRKNPENERHCILVIDHALAQWEYELSYNQIANGINLFIKAWKASNHSQLK